MTRTAWDHGGKTRHQRGYGRQHVKLRAELLAREPLCRHCRAKGKAVVATIADHVVSLAKGGAVHDIDNLQPLCLDCHNDKTLREQGKTPRRRQTIGEDGWPIE